MTDFLEGVPQEGGDILKEGQTVSELAQESESPTEEVEETGAEPEENTEIKFDKDKTAKRFETLTKHNQELKAELEEIRAWKEQLDTERESAGDTVQIPEWFYGDEKAWAKYQDDWKQREEALLAKIEEKEQAKVQQEVETKQYWEGWVDEQLESLEESVGKIDRNRLMAIVEKYKPTTLDGDLDFQAGYELMQEMDAKKSTTEAKKNIADTSTSVKTTSDDSYQGMTKVF